AVGIGHELAHAGARVAHAAPRARVADGLGVAGKHLVLGAIAVTAGPRLHHAHVEVHHDLGLQTLLGEVAFLEGDPLVQSHAGGKDVDLHDVYLPGELRARR